MKESEYFGDSSLDEGDCESEDNGRDDDEEDDDDVSEGGPPPGILRLLLFFFLRIASINNLLSSSTSFVNACSLAVRFELEDRSEGVAGGFGGDDGA